MEDYEEQSKSTSESTSNAREWSVTLDYPIKVHGIELEKLDFRRPKTKDVRLFSDSKIDGDMRRMVNFIAKISLNQLAPEDIDEVDAGDFQKISKGLETLMGGESKE
jgi:hypothetical protein